jgi:hypothetical protein
MLSDVESYLRQSFFQTADDFDAQVVQSRCSSCLCGVQKRSWGLASEPRGLSRSGNASVVMRIKASVSAGQGCGWMRSVRVAGQAR